MLGMELATQNTLTAPHAGVVVAKVFPTNTWMQRIEQHPSWDKLAQLQITMRVGVPLNRFRVKDLLSLQVGQVIESLSPKNDDIPVAVGDVQLGWCEFEIIEQRIGLRLTRLG
jgi:flagellar motor switch protein FliM